MVSDLVKHICARFVFREDVKADMDKELGALLKPPKGLTVFRHAKLVEAANSTSPSSPPYYTNNISSRIHCPSCGRGYTWAQVFGDASRAQVLRPTCTYQRRPGVPCGASLVNKVHRAQLEGGVRYDAKLVAPIS